MNPVKALLAAAALVAIAACDSGKDPGPLAGSWRVIGPQRMKMHFRRGEVEALGTVDQVSYKREGDEVIVTYLSGSSAGKTLRFTMTGPNNATSEIGALYRSK